MRDRRLLVVVLVGAVLWTAALAVLLGTELNGLIDLRVYRTGGEAWLRGMALYDVTFPAPLPGPQLPFTYPPLAAVLFSALSVLPWWIAVVVVIGTGIAGLAAACRLVAARLIECQPTQDGASARARVALLAAAATGAAPLIEPIRESVSFGQINLLLMCAITADCLLRRTPWPRGALIGLAAAVKLTPAAFVLFFIARRQWRPVLAAAGAFVAAGLLGLALAPRDTRAYWFGALLDPARIGGLEFTSNQSLRGLLHRLGLADGVETAVWLGLSALIGVLALAGVAALSRQNLGRQNLSRRGDDVAALLVTAAAALLVSPVSWSHHWVWAVLGLMWLADRASRRRTRVSVALFAGTLAVFAAAPFWWLPYRDERELHWPAGLQLLGNVYVWVAMAVILAGVMAAIRARRTRRTRRTPDDAIPLPPPAHSSIG
jgi:alpha-1,2-mannosyltransferase